MSDKIRLVRQYLDDSNLDAWLIIDFRENDPTGKALLGELTPHSRLYAILISSSDPITIIKSPVESNELIGIHSLIKTIDTRTQASLLQVIQQVTKTFQRIALNYGKNPQTDVLPTGRYLHLQKAMPKITWE